MTDSYGCFSAYHVVLADCLAYHVVLAEGLPYRQLFMYIQWYS